MLITYKFADGKKLKIDVSEDIGNVILESRRKEHADNERHRYHKACSYDSLAYEGDEALYCDFNPLEKSDKREFYEKISKAFESLTPTQKKRLLRFINGETIADIARSEGTTFNSVKECLTAAQKKFKKFL